VASEVEIVITGQDRSGPAWESLRQEAQQTVRGLVSSIRQGTEQIDDDLGKVANDLSSGLSDSAAAGIAGMRPAIDKGLNNVTADFAEAGQEAGKILADHLRSGAAGVEQEAEKAGKRAGDALVGGISGEVRRGGSEIGSATDRSLSGVVGAADDAGKKAGNKLQDGLKAGAVAAGAAAGAALLTALDTSAVQTRLAASLGAEGDWAADLGRITGEVYSRGVVSSVEEAGQAVQAVWRTGLIPEDSTNSALESISAKVANLGTVFGEDLTPLAAAAAKMVKTGLAEDGAQALDILTVGLEGSANVAGDLVDTFTEYPTQFRKLGLTGGQALKLIQQALRGGARDSDIAADALKTFAIEAMTSISEVDSKGGTKLTAVGQAFKDVGLDGAQAQAELAKGGVHASTVLGKVLDGLRGIKDPVDRSQAAVALFGTQAEDLGDALYAMDLDSTTQGLGRMAGAADRVGKTMESSASAQVTKFRREAEQMLTNVAGGFLKFAADNSAVMGPLIAAIGGITMALLGAAAAMAVFNMVTAMNPIVLVVALVVAAVAGLVAALMYLWQTNDALRAAVTAGWSAIGSAISSAVGAIGPALASVGAWFTRLPGLISENAGRIPGIVGSAFSQMANLAAYWAGYAVGWTVLQLALLPVRALSAIAALPGLVGQVLSWAASRGQSGAATAVSWVTNQFRRIPGAVGRALSSLPGTVQSAASGAGSWLYRAGQDIVRGAIRGVQSMASSAYNSVANIGGNMVSGFRDAIGWHSPAAAFVPGGQAIVQGIQQGIGQASSPAVMAVSGLGTQLASALPGPAASSPAALASGGGGATRLLVEIRGGDGSALDDLLVQILRKRIRVEGGGSVQAAFGTGGW
jgi:phage-related minor tail protein